MPASLSVKVDTIEKKTITTTTTTLAQLLFAAFTFKIKLQFIQVLKLKTIEIKTKEKEKSGFWVNIYTSALQSFHSNFKILGPFELPGLLNDGPCRFLNRLIPFHSQEVIGNSPDCLPYNSYDVNIENLVLDQLIIL